MLVSHSFCWYNTVRVVCLCFLLKIFQLTIPCVNIIYTHENTVRRTNEFPCFLNALRLITIRRGVPGKEKAAFNPIFGGLKLCVSRSPRCERFIFSTKYFQVLLIPVALPVTVSFAKHKFWTIFSPTSPPTFPPRLHVGGGNLYHTEAHTGSPFEISGKWPGGSSVDDGGRGRVKRRVI